MSIRISFKYLDTIKLTFTFYAFESKIAIKT
jgi:hypothetical protein